jgi:TRAP-type C4-dicarboxylate transport system permease small subunit
MIALLKSLDLGLARVFKVMAIICFVGLFVLLALGVLVRTFPIIAISGYDEVVELLFAWMTFITTVALWREGALYRVTVIEDALPARYQPALEVLIQVCMLTFALILVFYGLRFVEMSSETTPFLRIDRIYWYSSLPICGVFMTIYSVIGLWRSMRGKLALEKNITLGS